MEGRRGAHGGVGRERAGDERRLQAAVGAEEAAERQRGRDLGAVDEREALLGGEHDGREAGPAERLGGGQALALEDRLALADHGGGHVRERREIARGADRALPGDDRQDVAGEHRLDERHGRRLHPRGAAAEGGELEREDEADHRRRQRLAHAAAVREDEVALQRRHVAGLDADRGELAEAGVDAVDGRRAGGDRADAGGGAGDAGGGGGVEPDRRAVAPDALEVAERNPAGGDGQHVGTPRKTRVCAGTRPIQ